MDTIDNDDDEQEFDEFFPSNYDLEDVFDKLVMPQLKAIVNICDEHDIPMVASFQYAADGERAKLCTCMILPKSRTNQQITDAVEVLTSTE